MSFNASISACEKGKQWEGARGLLQELVHQLLTLNVVSFNASISACERGKQWEEAAGRPVPEPSSVAAAALELRTTSCTATVPRHGR